MSAWNGQRYSPAETHEIQDLESGYQGYAVPEHYVPPVAPAVYVIKPKGIGSTGSWKDFADPLQVSIAPKGALDGRANQLIGPVLVPMALQQFLQDCVAYEQFYADVLQRLNKHHTIILWLRGINLCISLTFMVLAIENEVLGLIPLIAVMVFLIMALCYLIYVQRAANRIIKAQASRQKVFLHTFGAALRTAHQYVEVANTLDNDGLFLVAKRVFMQTAEELKKSTDITLDTSLSNRFHGPNKAAIYSLFGWT